MIYEKKIHEKRIYVFDEVQKQKSSIVRFVLDVVEDISPDISEENIDSIRKTLFREIDKLHLAIEDANKKL